MTMKLTKNVIQFLNRMVGRKMTYEQLETELKNNIKECSKKEDRIKTLKVQIKELQEENKKLKARLLESVMTNEKNS